MFRLIKESVFCSVAPLATFFGVFKSMSQSSSANGVCFVVMEIKKTAESLVK